MDSGTLWSIAFQTHHFCNPITEQMLDRVLAMAGLEPGMRAADLGCGNAVMSKHLATRYGLVVDAVEYAPPMAALARVRLAEGGEGVILHEAAAAQFMEDRLGQYDLILILGAMNFVPGVSDHAEIFAWFARRLRPGGCLLFGDLNWKRQPSERLAAAVTGRLSHADYIRAGEAAGLLPLYAVESEMREFDEYSWRISTVIENYAAERPDDPVAQAARRQAILMRTGYVEEGRDAMGFGLYLFRAP